MKKFFTLVLFSLFSAYAFCQQEAMFTHYMFNTQAVNPAYAGSLNALSVTALNRSQWIGFDGAPVTQTLTVNAPVVSKNIGFGVTVLNDKIGFVRNTAIFADFAYKIRIATKSWIAFGLKGGFDYRNADFFGINLENQDDPDFLVKTTNLFLPNFGAGIYYFNPKFYLGFSVPKLIKNDFDINQTFDDLSGQRKHYYIITGYLIELNEDWKMKPTAYLKVSRAVPVQFDITSQFIWRDKFWLGGMFRTSDALGLLAGFYLSPQLAVGYSFDWSYKNTSFRYNAGSHEIVIRFDAIYQNKKEIISPRYF